MAAVWLRIRAGLPASARSMLLLIVLVAVGGGCVLTAVCGARRTQTAMRRFVAYDRPEDLSLFFNSTPALAERVLRAPEVRRTSRLPFLMMSTDPTRLGKVGVFGASDDNALETIDRPLVLRGRLSDPARPDEAVVNELAATREHLALGDRVTLYGFSTAQIATVTRSGFRGTERPAGPRFVVRIVGVIRQPADISVVPVAQDSTYDSLGSLYTTRAFMHAYAARIGIPFDQLPGNEIVRVQLRHGASQIAAFAADANRIAGDRAQLLPGSDTRITASTVQRGIDVEAIALLIFAALAAVAVVVLVGFTLTRAVRVATADFRHLTTLGMTHAQVLGVTVAWPLAAVLLGCIGAMLVAVAASPLTPVGIARQAEVHPGVSINVALLGAAVAALFVLLAASVVAGAIRATRRRVRREARRSRTSKAARRFSSRPAAVLGIGAAWSRRQGATAGGTAIAAVAIATAAAIAAVTFAASLEHLVASPRQQGWNFDVVVGNVNDQNDQIARDAPKLAGNQYVAAFSAVAMPPETPTIDGQRIDLAGVGEIRGHLEPVMLEGRFARGANELVLGRASLRSLHKHIGDDVTITAGARHLSARITGVDLSLSAGSDFNTRLNRGALLPLPALKRLEPDAFVTVFLVRFAPGADRGAALASLRRDFGRDILQHIPAQDVANLDRVSALPALLAALIALLALVALAHNLFTSINQRRRTFATLKAVGFVRGQLTGSVLWQTAAIAVAGIVVGAPAGVVVGRTTWRLVAGQIGSVQPPVAPPVRIALCIAIAALLAGLVAVGPAWRAARTRTGVALREE